MQIKNALGFLARAVVFSMVFCAVAGGASWAVVKITQGREATERACKADQRTAYDKEMAERERQLKESAAQGEQMAAMIKRYEAELTQRELNVKREAALLAEQERRLGLVRKN